ALEHQLHGLTARVLGEPRRFQSPDIDLELAAKPGADVLADHVNVVLRNAQGLGKLVAQDRNALRRGPDLQALRVGPLHDLTVGLKATTGDDRYAVVAFGNNCVGVLKRLVRITFLQLDCGLHAIARLADVFLGHQVRKLLVFNLDFADGVFSDFFALRRHHRDFVALPLGLLAGAFDDAHGFHAGQFFGLGGVNGLHRSVRVRGAQDLAEEHPWSVDVKRVFGPPAGFDRSVDALDAFADEPALARFGPVVLTLWHEPLPSSSWQPRARPA